MCVPSQNEVCLGEITPVDDLIIKSIRSSIVPINSIICFFLQNKLCPLTLLTNKTVLSQESLKPLMAIKSRSMKVPGGKQSSNYCVWLNLGGRHHNGICLIIKRVRVLMDVNRQQTRLGGGRFWLISETERCAQLLMLGVSTPITNFEDVSMVCFQCWSQPLAKDDGRGHSTASHCWSPSSIISNIVHRSSIAVSII